MNAKPESVPTDLKKSPVPVDRSLNQTTSNVSLSATPSVPDSVPIISDSKHIMADLQSGLSERMSIIKDVLHECIAAIKSDIMSDVRKTLSEHLLVIHEQVNNLKIQYKSMTPAAKPNRLKRIVTAAIPTSTTNHYLNRGRSITITKVIKLFPSFVAVNEGNILLWE